MEQEVVIGGRMKTTDIDIAVARNVVNEALLESLHALTRSKDSRNSSRDRRVTSQQGIEVPVHHKRIGVEALWMLRNIGGACKVLLRRRRRVGRTVKDGNSSRITRGHAASKERSGRSRLVGGVRRSAILKSRNFLGGDLGALGHDTSTTRGVRDIGVRDISRETTLCEVGCGEARVDSVRSLSVSVGGDASGSITSRIQELAVSRGDIGVHDRGNCAIGTDPSSVDSKTTKLIDNSIHTSINRAVIRKTGQISSGFMAVANLGSQIMLRNTTSISSSHRTLGCSRGGASFSAEVIIGRHGASRMIWHSHLDCHSEVSYDSQYAGCWDLRGKQGKLQAKERICRICLYETVNDIIIFVYCQQGGKKL